MDASRLVLLLGLLGLASGLSPYNFARCECGNGQRGPGRLQPGAVRSARVADKSFRCSHDEVIVVVRRERGDVDLCLDTSVAWVQKAMACMRQRVSAGPVACVRRAMRRHKAGPARTRGHRKPRGKKRQRSPRRGREPSRNQKPRRNDNR